MLPRIGAGGRCKVASKYSGSCAPEYYSFSGNAQYITDANGTPKLKYCLPLEKKFQKTCSELQRRFYKKLKENCVSRYLVELH